jgi:hypothetical protein
LATGNQVASENSRRAGLEEERREFEAVAVALANSTRLLRLITYIGDKYFHGDTEDLNEYNIATDVFGRSKTTFNAGEDAIVRVEMHRLRKRLKEYYETEAVDHPIQLSIPPASYGPVFARRPGHIENLKTEAAPSRPRKGWSWLKGWRWLYLAAPLMLALTILGVYQIVRERRAEKDTVKAAIPNARAATTSNLVAYAETPLRILAGYTGKPRIDTAGAYWESDRYFTGGAAYQRPDIPVTGTSDPMLFEHWRTGDSKYDIPLAPGLYELHLFFVASQPEDFKASFFNVGANGQSLLESFNISSDALGLNVADERVFKNIYPDKDGYLHLTFSMGRSAPSVNAIEILSGLPHRQLPVRLVMQPSAVTDHNGNLWHPDTYFQSGALSDFPREVGGTPDPNLFAQERYGHFTYSIPVDTRSRYTLVLHFAELYWGPKTSGSGGAGSRVFRVFCNGSTLLDDFDIFKEAGGLSALTKTFYHLRPSPQGKLNLTFEPIVNYATVSAIEVIDESQ